MYMTTLDFVSFSVVNSHFGTIRRIAISNLLAKISEGLAIPVGNCNYFKL